MEMASSICPAATNIWVKVFCIARHQYDRPQSKRKREQGIGQRILAAGRAVKIERAIEAATRRERFRDADWPSEGDTGPAAGIKWGAFIPQQQRLQPREDGEDPAKWPEAFADQAGRNENTQHHSPRRRALARGIQARGVRAAAHAVKTSRTVVNRPANCQARRYCCWLCLYRYVKTRNSSEAVTAGTMTTLRALLSFLWETA